MTLLRFMGVGRDSPAVSTPRLRRGDVVRVKGSALVEIRYRLGEVLDVDVNGGEVTCGTARGSDDARADLARQDECVASLPAEEV